MVSGTAKLFVWSAVIASATIIAGLAYDAPAVVAAWSSRQHGRGEPGVPSSGDV
jgi:hypothetical protein